MVHKIGGGIDFKQIRVETVHGVKDPEDIAEIRKENSLLRASELAAVRQRFVYPQTSAH